MEAGKREAPSQRASRVPLPRQLPRHHPRGAPWTWGPEGDRGGSGRTAGVPRADGRQRAPGSFPAALAAHPSRCARCLGGCHVRPGALPPGPSARTADAAPSTHQPGSSDFPEPPPGLCAPSVRRQRPGMARPCACGLCPPTPAALGGALGPSLATACPHTWPRRRTHSVSPPRPSFLELPGPSPAHNGFTTGSRQPHACLQPGSLGGRMVQHLLRSHGRELAFHSVSGKEAGTLDLRLPLARRGPLGGPSLVARGLTSPTPRFQPARGGAGRAGGPGGTAGFRSAPGAAPPPTSEFSSLLGLF